MAYDPERIVNMGELEKRGKTVRFGIKEKDRSRHIYVIGQTGTGKSTLLEMLAMQDIRNGTGLIFMDPHGQSVEALLKYVTREHLDKIIYFAPHHQERPIGLNIMEDIGYDKRHLVVSSLMASFEKIWGAGTWSDRMAYILQNTLLALIEYPDTTLLDVGRMYSSKSFREKVVANLKDPQVRKYWVEEFANYTERYAQEATPSIQNKLGQFTSNPLMRNIIGQKESAFNFREIMDEGKILLVNLSKGQIGENNARMLGVLFTTKIYLAALSRSDLTKAELEAASPCNFFVDEFQSFANSSFSDILSEARKYKLNLVMAHQYLGQLYSDDSGGGDVIRDAVFGNVGTFVSFRVGPVDAEIISKQFAPDISEEDLVALPRYHIYLTLNIDGAGSTPFSARTFYEPAPEGESLEDEVVQQTMDTYGVDRAVIEKIVEDNLAEDAQADAATKKKGGGQRGGGQKGGSNQKSNETHTPLKGLVQQMIQQTKPTEKKETKPEKQPIKQKDIKEKILKKSPIENEAKNTRSDSGHRKGKEVSTKPTQHKRQESAKQPQRDTAMHKQQDTIREKPDRQERQGSKSGTQRQESKTIERQKSHDTTESKREGRKRKRVEQNKNQQQRYQKREIERDTQRKTNLPKPTPPKTEKKRNNKRGGQERDVKMPQEKEMQDKKEQTKENPQPINTTRRPNGITVGTVRRSATAHPPRETNQKQQQNTEQQSKQQDEQQDEKQQRGQQRSVSGGLGDLVQSAKASGLRKDLKVTSKKEKAAPPVSYEEGWVAIGDLSKTSE